MNNKEKLLEKIKSNNRKNIFLNRMSNSERIVKACSTIYGAINGSGFSCSGSFVTQSVNDLKYGLFLTAAHCIVSITDETVSKVSLLYITNPIDNKWYSIDINNIYYDGIADVAIIKTDIDFSLYPYIPLQFSSENPRIGDDCLICGNPFGVDNDSISKGNIRDPNFMQSRGQQIVNSLYINAPGVSGNSGSPILNMSGNIIGLFTFGASGYETLGGGANLETLNKTLIVLTKFPENGRNTDKKYLGLQWSVTNPFILRNLYESAPFDNKGAFISEVSDDSPFKNILNSNDVLLSATLDNGVTYDFGNLTHQRTPGVICYDYNSTSCSIKYLSNGQLLISDNIRLDKTYQDVPAYKDAPLHGGLIDIKNSNLL